MQIERIHDLRQLEPEWQSLWARLPSATPFQHPGWLLPWWETFGSGELFSFAVRDEDRLAGLGLMFLHSWEGRRQVTFIGNGISDRLDLLVEDAGIARLILKEIARQKYRWDLCDLQDLSDNSLLLSAPAPEGIRAKVCPQYACSAIPLPLDLPHGLRRNLRRYRSQLEAQGAVSFETAAPEQLDEYMDALIKLHRERWAMKDDRGMLDGASSELFHRKAAWNLFRAGLVRLHALRLNGSVAAVVYVLIHRQRAYSYLGGFDPALRRFSPGALILHYTIERAIQDGVTVFDFLRGDEPYKSEWGAVRTVSSRLRLWSA